MSHAGMGDKCPRGGYTVHSGMTEGRSRGGYYVRQGINDVCPRLLICRTPGNGFMDTSGGRYIICQGMSVG